MSTGINRVQYPVDDLPSDIWQKLPTKSAQAALVKAAQTAYGTSAPLLALAGAQAAIQLLPTLGTPGRARVLGPTYNEHAAALQSAGWQVIEVDRLDCLNGAELAVVVNPNNPDGRGYSAQTLLDLSKKVGTLIVDESFADPQPELSIAKHAGQDGLFVLRSFGKFYGLAGLRLGFVIGPQAQIDRLQEISGPWPVSGPAIEIGCRALTDREWAEHTITRLRDEAQTMDQLAEKAGFDLVGGTELFRLYEAPDAQAAQDRLARHQIWSRIFPWSDRLIRLGLPGPQDEWNRLGEALQ